MNRKDDFSRTLEAWLRREAPPQAPDRVLDAALQRVSVESQRRSVLQRLIGGNQMSILTRAAAMTAVLAVAALIGFQFGSIVGRNDATPSPSSSLIPTPTATPSATPSPEPSASLPAYCVSEPELADLSELMWPLTDGVACYGDGPLTFDASWAGGGVADCPTMPEPAWLACSAYSLRPVGETRKVGVPELFVAVDPASSFEQPEVGSDVRVTGHFDDPAAASCRETATVGGETPAPPTEIVERCRRVFVVTDATPLEP
jgi:hypothetical protein